MSRLRPALAALAAAVGLLALPGGASAAHHRVVTTLRYGPFVVPAMGVSTGQPMDMGAMKSFTTQTAPPCRGCSITAMRASLVNRHNRVQNWNTGVMLHHVVLFNRARPDLTCPPTGRFWRQRFFASGNERTPMRLPRGFGYRIHARDNWRVLTDLMNMSMRPRTLYVRIRVVYTKRHLKPVTPMWLDVNNCGNSEYSIPKGRSRTTWSYRSPVSGRFVAAAGHLHDGGVHIVLRNATRHHTIVDSVAGYRRRHAYLGHISSMTGRRGRHLGRVRAGDMLRLHSVYDSPTARDDVMGIVLAYLAGVHR